MTVRNILIISLSLLLVSTGCTVVHTSQLAARKGDTVIVSIGSPLDPTTNAITGLTWTPDDPPNTPIVIPTTNIISMFNLYADKKSFAWLYSDADLIENQSGHGPWNTVFALTVPNNLSEGKGSLQITTDTANYPGTIPAPNGFDVALEILPASAGAGETSSWDYLGIGQVVIDDPLSLLEPMKRLEFRPTYTGYDDVNTYGAVEVKIAIDKTGISEDDFNIILDDKVGTIQSRNVSFSWNAKRFETTVYMISPTGELQYSDVNFSIISTDLQNQFEAGSGGGGQDVSSVVVTSTTWYDIDGNVDTGGPAVQVINLTGT